MPYTLVPHRFSVPFEELDGSPEELVTRTWGGTSATRRVKCLVRDRVTLVNELLGYTANWTIHPPAPYGPDILGILASSVSIKPFGKLSQNQSDDKYANYDYCIIDISFEAMEKVLSGIYGYITITETLRDASEFVTLPTKNLFWGTGGGAVAITPFDAPGKINAVGEWIYEISGASAVPSVIFHSTFG